MFSSLSLIRTNSPALLFGLSLIGGISLRAFFSRIHVTKSQIQRLTTSSSKGDDKRRKSLVYTRTGDGGTSMLYNGERRLKTDIVFDALGHQDELNSYLGIAREYCVLSQNHLEEKISIIQSTLFDLGAAIATPIQTSSEQKKAYTKFSPHLTEKLEEWIDELDATLPPLTQFVIPSGGLCSVHLNYARTLCRRAERAVVPLVHAEQVDTEVSKYLNRLSDFLFVASRIAATKDGHKEILWKKQNNP